MKKGFVIVFLGLSSFAKAQFYFGTTPRETREEPFTTTYNVYVQGSYAFSNSQGSPLSILKHYDIYSQEFINYIDLLVDLQHSPATWTIQPQYSVGLNTLGINNNTGFGSGFEIDLTYLSYTSTQQTTASNSSARLNFSGTEFRWKLKFVFAYQLKKFTARAFYGFTSGFAKNYNADLSIYDGNESVYPANQDLFRKTDFQLVGGASFGYQLTEKFQVIALWEINRIITSKYLTTESYLNPYLLYGLSVNQIALRLSYQLGKKEYSLPISRKVKTK